MTEKEDVLPEGYDPDEFEHPSVTVDDIIFTVREGDLKVLQVKRDEKPFKGIWSIPGGFIDMEEPLEASAERILEEKTGVGSDVYLEQLYTFGDPGRDPRTRFITVSYFAIVNNEKVSLENSESTEWHSVYSIPELGFDHEKIINYALKRLRWKLEYTPAAFSFLPEEFTLTQLQDIYETVFNKEFDKRNFRKKIKKKGLVEYTGKRRTDVSHRPPKLYRQKVSDNEIVEII